MSGFGVKQTLSIVGNDANDPERTSPVFLHSLNSVGSRHHLADQSRTHLPPRAITSRISYCVTAIFSTARARVIALANVLGNS
jgi:hypothetical protein